MDQSSFNYLKVLGQGSFGKVLMAEHKTTNDVFAIKVGRRGGSVVSCVELGLMHGVGEKLSVSSRASAIPRVS